MERRGHVDRPSPTEIYSVYLTGINARLSQGAITIKRGHRVEGLSHAGEVTELPLTPRQIVRREWHRDVLEFRSIHGPSKKLPSNLAIRNPHRRGYSY